MLIFVQCISYGYEIVCRNHDDKKKNVVETFTSCTKDDVSLNNYLARCRTISLTHNL